MGSKTVDAAIVLVVFFIGTFTWATNLFACPFEGATVGPNAARTLNADQEADYALVVFSHNWPMDGDYAPIREPLYPVCREFGAYLLGHIRPKKSIWSNERFSYFISVPKSVANEFVRKGTQAIRASMESSGQGDLFKSLNVQLTLAPTLELEGVLQFQGGGRKVSVPFRKRMREIFNVAATESMKVPLSCRAQTLLPEVLKWNVSSETRAQLSELQKRSGKRIEGSVWLRSPVDNSNIAAEVLRVAQAWAHVC